MKKRILIILTICMMLSFIGCGSESSPGTDPGDTSDKEAGETIAVKLGDTVAVGSWEYTLDKIEFAPAVSAVLDYDHFYSSVEQSSPNSLRPNDGEVFGVVTYKLKNIGKNTLDPYGYDTIVGTGVFIYGDGYEFKNDELGQRAVPWCYDAKSGRFDNVYREMAPLGQEIEWRVVFVLPKEAAESDAEPLSYVVTFDETGDDAVLTYTIR